MTDFARELEGRVYQLVNGMIELEDFKAWYAMSMATRTQSAEPTHFTPPKPKNPEFSDYYETPYEPMDADMEAHHRKLLGGGDQ